MIARKRNLLHVGAGLSLILAGSACNLFRMIDPSAAITTMPEGLSPPQQVATVMTEQSALDDATEPATQTNPTAGIDTATPEAETTSFRKDEDFGSYLLTTYTQTTLYPITGSTAEELDTAIELNGPRDEASDTAWYALTIPLFDWDWGCVCDESGCRSDSVAISLSVSYSLPAWHFDDPPPDLLAQWTAFEHALTAHERGHGELAHACAMSLGERVAAVAGAESCEVVDQRALAEINDALSVCRAEQRSYEDSTNHGTNEGVVWPP